MRRMLLLILMSLLVPGCGGGRPDCVPISGRVLIDGAPLRYGFIRFTPEGGRPATAELDAQGHFTLTTFEHGDGAVRGTHTVTVLAAEPLGGGTQRWHAPKRYAHPRTSKLTRTIDGPDDALVIDLTWEGGKPFVERLSAGE